MISFPFFVYLLCSRLAVRAMTPKLKQKIKDMMLDALLEEMPKHCGLEAQEKGQFYIGLLRNLTPEQFFVIVRLTKHSDFGVFLYLLDCVREDFRAEMKNYKVTKK